ncbi:MAG TPA: ABC transporter permease [Xanthobacteraceae bacterium]|nr:ABC transporter permease [Xanthobacteraceae bacterium]
MTAINGVQTAAAQAAPQVAAKRDRIAFWYQRPFYRYGFVLVIVALWELFGPLVNPILFSYPSKILIAAFQLTFVTGELPYYAWQSLQVLMYGLGLGILVGIPLAVVMARVRQVDWALEIPINALYATPTVALVPLLVLWFGIYMQAKVVVVFLFAVFPVLINTYQGVRECDKNMLEVARSFRSSELQIWRHVLLPFSVPYIAAGIRLAIGRGLVGMVVAEFFTSISGLGYMITRYAHVFETDKTFVPVLLLMILGVALTAALKRLERRIAPWSRADS